ncbi:MAG: ThiF family adenylyltransferase [Aigarchaeota archaeon]|nr:ThiF family adenylyltransferase [Aigarchaeota archaeon]MDW8092512.1 ThiF family adenylyltransferase [Nitrososphaerota archaeon]
MRDATSNLIEDRYDRQLRIKGWDQEKVQSATVTIVGVGALGCELAKNLALVGVGKLVLIDNDVVELSNLNRQSLFTDRDIGRPKVSVARDRLRDMNPFVGVEEYYSDVRSLPESLFDGSAVVCSCLDSWGVRRWLNSLCVELRKVLVDGAISGFFGNVQVVIPMKTSCLECHGQNLIPADERMAECTLRRRRPIELVEDLSKVGINIDGGLAERLFELNIKTVYDVKYTKLELLGDKLPGDIKEKILDMRDKLKPRVPAVQSVSATIAGMMTTEVLKVIHGNSLGPPLKSLLVYDAIYNRVTKVRLKRREGCVICGVKTDEPTRVMVSPTATIHELKELIAREFGFPDVEILFGSRVMADELNLSDSGLTDGSVVYAYTNRLHEPLPIRLHLSSQNP